MTASPPTFPGSKVFSCLSGKLAELAYYIREEREEEPRCKDWLQGSEASYFSLFVLEFQVDFIFGHSPFSHPNLASVAAGIASARLQDKLVLGHLHPEDNKTKQNKTLPEHFAWSSYFSESLSFPLVLRKVERFGD